MSEQRRVEMCENCNRMIGIDETQHGCPCGCGQTVCRRCYKGVKRRVSGRPWLKVNA